MPAIVIHASTPERAERERNDKTRPMRMELLAALVRSTPEPKRKVKR